MENPCISGPGQERGVSKAIEEAAVREVGEKVMLQKPHGEPALNLGLQGKPCRAP